MAPEAIFPKQEADLGFAVSMKYEEYFDAVAVGHN